MKRKSLILGKQAMFKRFRHNNLSTFIISQVYYELPKNTKKSNGNIYNIFKPNNFRDAQNLFHDRAFRDMTLDEFKYLTSTSWNEKYQPLTIGMTKDRYTCRYRLGLNSLFISYSSLFQIKISNSKSVKKIITCIRIRILT